MKTAAKTTRRGVIKSRIDRFLRHPATDAFIMVLILISVILFVIEAYGIVGGDILTFVETTGDVLTIFFIVELSTRWLVSSGTKQHFREYWMDWLSVLPFFRPVRILRGLRLLRALRILRLYRMGTIAQRFLTGTDTHWFEKNLRNEIANYHGRYAEQVWLLPDLFRLLTNLLDDGRVDSESRRKICVALAYFITPFEVMPKEFHGPEGYLDQIYLSLKILGSLRENLAENVLHSAWEGEGDIVEIITQEMPILKEIIGQDGLDQVDRYLGLRIK